MSSSNPDIDAQKVLQRLSSRSSGLSTRDLARLLSMRPTDVNQALLSLQASGQVALRGNKWFSLGARADFASNAYASAARSVRNRDDEPRPEVRRALAPDADHDPEPPLSRAIDRRQSRWAVFRRLCDYYAESVRLDQRSSISANADDEFESIVCLDGAIPNSSRIQIRTRDTWHKWTRKITADQYLVLGYPIQRFRWRDTANAQDVDFISPVYVQSFRLRIEKTVLDLEAVGSIRINEGWLERRLKNVDERRAFIELCAIDLDTDDGTNQTNWSDCAQLLNHFYPDWCVERLDTNNTASTPSLTRLTKDGIYNRACLIAPPKSTYVKRLYRELLTLANDTPDNQLDQTALVHIFPHTPVDRPGPAEPSVSTDVSEIDVVGSQALSLNHEQMQATKAAATCGLSIIVGPPGTGKSRVVSAVLAQQALMNQSALLASRNHRALDAVVPRINAITEPWPLLIRLARAWNAPVDMSLHAAISQLVSSDLAGDLNHLTNVRAALARRISDHAVASRVVNEVGAKREALRKELFELQERLREVPEPYREASAIGYEQLPVPRELQEAVNALAEIPPFCWSLRWLWNYITNRRRNAQGLADASRIDTAMRAVFDTQGTLPKPPSNDTNQLLPFYRQAMDSWMPLTRANEKALQVRSLRRDVDSLPTTNDACKAEHDAANEVERLSVECIQEIAQQTGSSITTAERCKLANILAAIDNRSALDSEADHRRWSVAMKTAFPIFRKHYPLIATSNLSVSRDIDLQPALFDLLVIDEASQCDVASVIPLLFRARRSLIVGDPMQLSHITSLSAATDRHLRRQFGVDDIDLERFSYRSTSMFHLANTSASVQSRVSLRQHHRCHPSIAAYCSSTFYKDSWTVLTQDTGKSGLQWTDIPDDSKSANGGGAISQAQIDAICDEVKRLQDSNYRGSLGIVTPFRQQANRIRDAVHAALPHDFIQASRLLVDTADAFQGDERDVVLFSLVAGNSLPAGSLHFLTNGPNRFNVAVSRAKQLLHVFGDLNWARTSAIRHIQSLANCYDRERTERNRIIQAGFREDLVGPVWEPALATAMREAGLDFYQQYPACGRFLDFALFKHNLKLDVEVDGETHHRSANGERISDDIRRDQALSANGWTIIRFWVYELREDMARCVNAIVKTLEHASR